MRDGIIMSALLNNAETWGNITKKNTLNLEKPDKILQEKLFEIKPRVRNYTCQICDYEKKFLKYIMDEPMETMKRKVFEEQRKETRKGDFINLISDDLKNLNKNRIKRN